MSMVKKLKKNGIFPNELEVKGSLLYNKSVDNIDLSN